jgi:hypothetical protein
MASFSLGLSGCRLAHASTAARASLERLTCQDGRRDGLAAPLVVSGRSTELHPEKFFRVTVTSGSGLMLAD